MANGDFVKFQSFALGMANGEHHLMAAGDVVKVYLTNATPNVATNTVKADLAGITEQNGYAAADIHNDTSNSSGTVSMTSDDYIEWTATVGGFGPFRYVVLYNDTHASDALIGYFDYGSAVTCANTGEKFKVDFAATIMTLA